MKRQYRIKQIGNDFHPQVRTKILWFGRWYRIGKHSDGYGLYLEIRYGLENKQLAEKVISDYKTWIKEQESKKEIVFHYID